MSEGSSRKAGGGEFGEGDHRRSEIPDNKILMLVKESHLWAQGLQPEHSLSVVRRGALPTWPVDQAGSRLPCGTDHVAQQTWPCPWPQEGTHGEKCGLTQKKGNGINRAKKKKKKTHTTPVAKWPQHVPWVSCFRTTLTAVKAPWGPAMPLPSPCRVCHATAASGAISQGPARCPRSPGWGRISYGPRAPPWAVDEPRPLIHCPSCAASAAHTASTCSPARPAEGGDGAARQCPCISCVG